MSTITVARRTIRREWTIFGTLLVLSVGLMGVSGTSTAHDVESGVNTALSPIETVINNAADTAGSYFTAITQIDSLRTQNEKLRQENQTLQAALDRMPAISKLSDDWTKITEAQQSVPYQTTPARVIVRDLSDVRPRTLILNKGSSDGLSEGEVVIDAGEALVGRIQSLEANVSTVLLISDPSAVVVGKAAKTGATGTIRGQISGQLQMQYVDVSEELQKGDSVVTAGETLPGTNDRSPYPPGLLIGEILEVSTDPNAVVQSADIQPAAHLSDATFVLVIMDYEGGFGPPVPSAGPSGSISPSGSLNPSAKPTAKPTVKPTAVPARTPTPPPQPVPSY
ncbi:MAG TPA: rod shape-determining protein MreC [Candidatus Limnocylindrales bacterium]|jgi:rod shape-determining protein MreC